MNEFSWKSVLVVIDVSESYNLGKVENIFLLFVFLALLAYFYVFIYNCTQQCLFVIKNLNRDS